VNRVSDAVDGVADAVFRVFYAMDGVDYAVFRVFYAVHAAFDAIWHKGKQICRRIVVFLK
jgi:hypothetical protein